VVVKLSATSSQDKAGDKILSPKGGAMSGLEMRSRKFYLSQALSLRESRRLESLLREHPAFDDLTHNRAFTAFTVKLTDGNYWVTGGWNVPGIIKDFLDECGITFEPHVVHARQAA
jgi:hypothetical protein